MVLWDPVSVKPRIWVPLASFRISQREESIELLPLFTIHKTGAWNSKGWRGFCVLHLFFFLNAISIWYWIKLPLLIDLLMAGGGSFLCPPLMALTQVLPRAACPDSRAENSWTAWRCHWKRELTEYNPVPHNLSCIRQLSKRLDMTTELRSLSTSTYFLLMKRKAKFIEKKSLQTNLKNE